MYFHWILKVFALQGSYLCDFPEVTEHCAAIASRLVLTVHVMLKMKALPEQQKREEEKRKKKVKPLVEKKRTDRIKKEGNLTFYILATFRIKLISRK